MPRRSERLEDRELECFGDACLVKPLEAGLGRGLQQGEEDGQQPLPREIPIEAAVHTAALDEAADACADRLVMRAGRRVRARCAGAPTDHSAGEAGFVTASVIDPFGNVLGVMYNPHYVDVLGQA